jgi:hypothetical protein
METVKEGLNQQSNRPDHVIITLILGDHFRFHDLTHAFQSDRQSRGYQLRWIRVAQWPKPISFTNLLIAEDSSFPIQLQIHLLVTCNSNPARL